MLDTILTALPQGKRLVEPFAGSGAVFLNAAYPAALVCDVNPDPILLFCLLRDKGESFIERCRELFVPENNNAERYYALREQFNGACPREERAALFLYLNRHGYNGLVRYNAKGRYNVPFGKHKKPYFPLREMRAFSCKSQDCGAEFRVADFRAVFAQLEPGDVVYCDPPYLPLGDACGFTAYAGRVFSLADHKALAAQAKAAQARGITVVLSNHDTPKARELYAGANIQAFGVRRLISCKGAGRDMASELLAIFA